MYLFQGNIIVLTHSVIKPHGGKTALGTWCAEVPRYKENYSGELEDVSKTNNIMT